MSAVFAQDSFEEVFGSMIAGSLPLAGVNAEAAVALVARDILGTEDVHTVSVREPVLKRILYFALPSKVLTSVPNVALPLTASLPGHPAHRGPGAYVLTHGNRSAAALFTGTQLRLLFNDRDLIAEAIAEQGLSEFNVNEVQDGYPLTSAYAALQQRVDTTSERVTRIAGVLTLLAGATLLGAQFATGFEARRHQRPQGTRAAALHHRPDPDLSPRRADRHGAGGRLQHRPHRRLDRALPIGRVSGGLRGHGARVGHPRHRPVLRHRGARRARGRRHGPRAPGQDHGRGRTHQGLRRDPDLAGGRALMASSLQDQVTTFFNVLGRLRPLAIVLVGTALVGTMFAGVAVRDAVQAFSKAQAVSAEEAAQVKLVRADLTDEDYTRYGGIVAGLYPGVRVEVPAGEGILRLSIDNIALYDAWIRGLMALQPNAKNVVWEAKSICLQECARGMVATADVQGYVQSVEFEQ
jgi:hypothetical protein